MCSGGRSTPCTSPTSSRPPRLAIASYTEIVKWLGTDDPTTRRLFEEILAVEEEHADDLISLLEDMHAH